MWGWLAKLRGVVAADGPGAGAYVFLKDDARPRRWMFPVDPKTIFVPVRVAEARGDWLRIGRAWVRRREALAPDEAIAYYGERIRASPTSLHARTLRAAAWLELGEHDRALGDFDAAIRLDPSDAASFYNRALAHRAKGDLVAAIADLTAALNLRPTLTVARVNRGLACQARGDPASALADFTDAIRLEPQAFAAYNNRAWLRATSRDPRLRSGRLALEDALQACELSRWQVSSCLDTLAAAAAEAGDFAEAVRRQEQALALVTVESQRLAALRRLDGYRGRQPYREPPHAPSIEPAP